MALEIPKDIEIELKEGFADPDSIIVKAEYQDMLPRPTDKEYNQMKESIRADGQEKAVVVDQEMVLIDGHTRWKICKELKKQVFYEKKYFKERTDILRHMAIANLHRRNLNQYQKVMLYNELYVEEKKKAMERRELSRKISSVTVHNIYASKSPSESAIQSGRKGVSGEPLQEKPKIEIEEQGRSRTAYAKLIGVSEVAVMQSHYIAEHGGKVINKQVKEGKLAIREAYWKAKEKVGLSRPVEKVKDYIFTITPNEGSKWTCHRKLNPSQIPAIKQYIEKMPVSRNGKKKK